MVTVEGIKLDEYTKGARRLGIDANDFDPDEVITYVASPAEKSSRERVLPSMA